MNDFTADLADYQTLLPEHPYRGIRPQRYADRNIFSARDWEKRQLLNLVSMFRGSLLFGQSGTGKSSLINAGLIPVLIEHDFNPEIMRVSPSRDGTFIVYRVAENDQEDRFLPSIFDNGDENKAQISVSFEQFRNTVRSLSAIASSGQTSVFVFDQFEELITLFEEVSGSTTDGGMDLHHRRQLQQELIDFFRDCYYDPGLRIKFIFVFREDYLAKFSKLFAAIPDLRQQSLRVKAIPTGDLQKIIVSPFKHPGSASKYPYSFTEDLIEVLTDRLRNYFQEEVILTDLQIVCQYIYETPHEQRLALLDNSNGRQPVRDIIRMYYERSIHSIGIADKPLAIEILQILVLNDTTRNIFHRDAIEKELTNKNRNTVEAISRMLEQLEFDTRLIRSERRAGGQYFEINSESLIPYINQLKREKEAEHVKSLEGRRLRRRLIYSACVVLCVLAIGTLLVQNKIAKANYAETYILASRNAWNPTLAYVIAKNAFGKSTAPPEMDNYQQKLEKKPGFFRTASLYFKGGINQAFFKAADTIGIIGERAIYYYGKSGIMLSEFRFPEGSSLMHANPEAAYLILDNNDGSYTYQHFNGKYPFTVKVTPSDMKSAIARDGQTFVLMGTIWSAEQGRPLGKITGDMDQVFFTNDSRHIIARAGFNIYRYSAAGVTEQFDYNTPLVEPQDVSLSADGKHLVTTDVFGQHPEYILFDSSLKTGHDRSDASEHNPQDDERRLELDEGNSKVTRVLMSPDDRFTVGIKGNEAIIWNRKGVKLGALQADGSIAGMSFSGDGKQILTWTLSGKVFTWKYGNLKDLYQRDELVDFSPYEYARAGLWDYSIEQAYAQGAHLKVATSPTEILCRALNYAGSLPKSNDHPDNEEYTDLLKHSVQEVSLLYRTVLKPALFKALPLLSRKQLCLSYAEFKTDSLYIVGNSEDATARMDAYLAGLQWKFKAAHFDRHHNETLFDLVGSYQNLAYSYIPAYNKSVAMTSEAIKLLQTAKTSPSKTRLQAECYGSLSYYRLFLSDFKGAIAASQMGLSLDGSQEWIYTNLALGLLLDGQVQKAQAIYKAHPKLKLSFVEDIDELMEAGVISPKTERYQEALEIRQMMRGR